MTGKYVLVFHPDDIFWRTTDPGWVIGISCGSMIAPLAHGVTNIIDEADFATERWCHILEESSANSLLFSNFMSSAEIAKHLGQI